jgi:three-Cys-motif partner protein
MNPIEYYKDREQTYLKHFFLERYLETVAYHIGFSQSQFVYVDCFSGPWRAADEGLGDTSIRIALNRLNSVRNGLAQQNRHPTIRAIFVEKSPAAFTTLQQVLREHGGEIKTTALPGTFEDNIDRILDQVGPMFAFFFVDPTGWTGFAMDNLRPILQRAKGEVMINFMYDPINRFLSFQSATNEESLDRCFGTADWRLVRDRSDRESTLVTLYVEQVRAAGGFDYATSSRILKPLQDRAYFHLVYATRNPKGIEKFRDVEKKVVTEQEAVRRRAQREHREDKSGQAEMDFGSGVPSPGLQDQREQQLRKADERLISLLQKGPVLYEVLKPRVLELRLVWSSDLNEILVQGHRSGRFLIEGLRPRERTPKAGCKIRLNPGESASK